MDTLDTGLGDGALQGLAFDGRGRLFVVDAAGDRIWRAATPHRVMAAKTRNARVARSAARA